MTDLVNFERWRKATENRSNHNRKADAFYVRFFGLPENISNYLGGQVKSITRPTLEFQTSPRRHRGAQYSEMENLTWTPISISLHDDHEGLTSAAVMLQIYRQQNRISDRYGNFDIGRDYRFDVEVSMYTADNALSEKYILKRCFIQSVDYADPNLAAGTDSEINIMIEFDNFDLMILDQLFEFSDPNSRKESRN